MPDESVVRVLAAALAVATCQPSASKGPGVSRSGKPTDPAAASAEPSAQPPPPPPPASPGAAPDDTAPAADNETEPAYDLTADLELRARQARAQFGTRASVIVVQDVFLIAGRRGAVAQSLGVVERALSAYFNQRFDLRPKRAVGVYLFASAGPYQRYCQEQLERACGSPYGFYQKTERRIVTNVGPGIGTLTHELVHPIVETDFPEAPDWIDEGIASLFERFYFHGKDQIGGLKNWRHPRLLRALLSPKERAWARLDNLFGMSDAVFRGPREDLHYAMARYLCQWLDSQNKLWPFYRKWRDEYADDPTGEKAFTEVVGVTPEDAHPRWARWVRSL